MATTIISDSKVVFSNSGAAANISLSGIEGGSLTYTFDVLALSGGGKAATIWSVDDGVKGDDNPVVPITGPFAGYNTDLLYKDAVGVAETSAMGAKFWITAAGTVQYDATSIADVINAYGAGETFTDTISYTIRLANGTLSVGTLKVSIAGVNDAATFGGVTCGSVTENTAESIGGTLTVSDADHGQTGFQAYDGPAGAHGTFSFDAATGEWTYTLTDQSMTGGEQVTETFTVKSLDGTTQDITVTVHGADDAAVIGGAIGGEVTENTAEGTGGTLTVSDEDHDQSGFQGYDGPAGAHGTFAFDAATGEWTYTLTDQSMTGGEQVTETFTVKSLDGTAQDITVTVHGADDAATITAHEAGSDAGSVSEDGTLTASGKLDISDEDHGQEVFQAPTEASLHGTYGDFTFNAATGAWSYALRNGDGNVQALNIGDHRTDILTVTSADGGTTHDITVTIDGLDDVRPVSIVVDYDPASSALGSAITEVYSAARPALIGEAGLNGAWTSWVNGLLAWRAGFAPTTDSNPTTTTVTYTYSNGQGTKSGTATFDDSFTYQPTISVPANVELVSGGPTIQYGLDLRLDIHVTDAPDGDLLPLLAANTTAAQGDFNGDSVQDTRFTFDGGGSLTLLGGSFTSISQLSDQIFFV